MKYKPKLILQYTGPLLYKFTKGTACFDLPLSQDIVITSGYNIIPLDIVFDIPDGYHVAIYPRSSALGNGLIIPTSIIDRDYKKSVHLICYSTLSSSTSFDQGTRLVQAMLVKNVNYEIVKVDAIADVTGRGGIGSTGK